MQRLWSLSTQLVLEMENLNLRKFDRCSVNFPLEVGLFPNHDESSQKVNVGAKYSEIL